MGEVHGRQPDEFNFGNSPFEISQVGFGGIRMTQRPNGVMASLVMAKANPSRAALCFSPDQMSLVAMR